MTRNYLRQPYPIFENSWKIIILISLFIAAFMLIFQPFGMSNYNGSVKPFFEAGYGIVTFAVLIIDMFVFPLFLDEWFVPRKWTVLHQIIWQIWILFSIGFGNFVYSSLFLHFSNGFHAFLTFQFYTVVVGTIPIVVMTILHQNALLSQNLKLASDMNTGLDYFDRDLSVNEKIRIVAGNGKDKLEITLSDFIYLSSTGNYIQVFYLKDQVLRNILLRITLKQVEEQVSECVFIIKCHRAFLVNKNKIVCIKGNSQGLRLILKDTSEEIPVSRNYSKNLKAILNG